MSDTYDGGMTEAERHYFSTGGDVNETLAREHGATAEVRPEPAPAPEPAAPHPQAPPAQPAPVAPAAPGQANLQPAQGQTQDEDPGDEIVPGSPNPRRVSFRKYQGIEQQLQEERRLRQEDAVKQARVEERLSLLQQALQPEQGQQDQPQAPERPDPQQDIFAYTQWLEDQLNTVTGKVSAYEQQIATGQTEMNEERQYVQSLNSYAGREPHFMQAYNFLLRNRAAELMASRYPQATFEQLMQAEIPPDVGDLIRQEERDLYKTSFAGNRNPAADIYRMAQMRGWRAPAAQAGNGAAPPAAAPASNGAAAPPIAPQQAPPAPVATAQQNGPAPTATQLVEAIRRGQPAAQSLSNGSGGTGIELTPKMLADMPQDQFEALYNDLMARNDKTKLRELFGA